MKILVLGGDGFIGRKVISSLENDAKAFEGDIRHDYEVDSAIECFDCIINLAGCCGVEQSNEFPTPYFETNVVGVFNILNACKKYGKRLIHISSMEALGGRQNKILDESAHYEPENIYGATKAAADILIMGWIATYGLNACIVRYPNIAGLQTKEGNSFLSRCINSLLKNERIKIHGNPYDTRDYVWIDDAVDAITMICRNKERGIFHIGSERELTLEYIAGTVIRAFGCNGKIEYVNSDETILRRYMIDTKKIRAMGWKPTLTFEEMCEKIIKESLRERMAG